VLDSLGVASFETSPRERGGASGTLRQRRAKMRECNSEEARLPAFRPKTPNISPFIHPRALFVRRALLSSPLVPSFREKALKMLQIASISARSREISSVLSETTRTLVGNPRSTSLTSSPPRQSFFFLSHSPSQPPRRFPIFRGASIYSISMQRRSHVQ